MSNVKVYCSCTFNGAAQRQLGLKRIYWGRNTFRRPLVSSPCLSRKYYIGPRVTDDERRLRRFGTAYVSTNMQPGGVWRNLRIIYARTNMQWVAFSMAFTAAGLCMC